MMRTPSFALLFMVVSCSDGLPVTRNQSAKTDGSGATATTVTQGVSDEQRLKDLQAKDEAETISLANLRDVNQKFCERIQKLRGECAATYRLIASTSDATLACAAGNNPGQSIASANFEVEFQSDGREYRILADNNWETNSFGNGKTALTWKARLPTSTQTPRLIDLHQIKLVPKDGAAVPGLGSVPKFILRANGVEALNTSDLTTSPESQGYFLLSLQRVMGLGEATTCKVSLDEITQIAASAQAAAGDAAAQNE